MKIAWLYGNHSISFNKPYTFLALGVRGSGKSAFLEHLAEQYLAEGACVLDLFGARSAEGLAWLRSKWVKEKKVLLLSAENAEVKTPSGVEAKPVSKLTLQDFEAYDLIISSCVLYPNIDSEFEAVNQIIDLLWRRRRWKRYIYVLCREAANIMYSRMKLAETQALAKTFLAYWLRESRHSGCCLGLDTQRFVSVDIDIRSLVDFLVLKAQGAIGLPKDMYYVYRYIEPSWLQYAKPHEFAIVSRRGDVGVGVFPLPEWHAREGEDVASKVGVQAVFSEQPFEGVNRGAYKTVSDSEHALIVSAYVEGEVGMVKLGERFKRSATTVNNIIRSHNLNVEKIGYCPACRRVKSAYAETPANRGVK